MPLVSPFHVPPATGGEVTNPMLETVIGIAERAVHGKIDDAEASLWLLTCAPLLRELLDWRRRVDVIRDMVETDNVVFLPAVRA